MIKLLLLGVTAADALQALSCLQGCQHMLDISLILRLSFSVCGMLHKV